MKPFVEPETVPSEDAPVRQCYRYIDNRPGQFKYCEALAERHAGLDAALLHKRVNVYKAAKKRHPERWSGTTRNWQPVCVVHLNPDQRVTEKRDRKEEYLELKMAA